MVEAGVGFGHFTEMGQSLLQHKVDMHANILLTGRKDGSDFTTEHCWSSPIQIWYPGRGVHAKHLCIIDNF